MSIRELGRCKDAANPKGVDDGGAMMLLMERGEEESDKRSAYEELEGEISGRLVFYCLL
jgi:hypothetical protein